MQERKTEQWSLFQDLQLEPFTIDIFVQLICLKERVLTITSNAIHITLLAFNQLNNRIPRLIKNYLLLALLRFILHNEKRYWILYTFMHDIDN